jgi:hypothetical protein
VDPLRDGCGRSSPELRPDELHELDCEEFRLWHVGYAVFADSGWGGAVLEFAWRRVYMLEMEECQVHLHDCCEYDLHYWCWVARGTAEQ